MPRTGRSGVSAFLNLRVTLRLIALIAIPTAMGLTFGAIRVATADSASNQFGQIERWRNWASRLLAWREA